MFPGLQIHKYTFAVECRSYSLRGADSAVCEGPLRGGGREGKGKEGRVKEREKATEGAAVNSLK